MQIIERCGRVAGAGVLALVLTACMAAPQGGHGDYSRAGYPYNGPVQSGNQPWGQRGHQVEQGRVVNIETVRVQDPGGVGAGGAIVGGVVGGVLGNQVGKGTGRTLATIAGVVGGALAGSAVQNSVGGGSVRDMYRATVQLRDGSVRAFDYPQPPPFQVGDYVRIDGDQVYR